MLRVESLTIEVAGRVLVDEASFTVAESEKVGIIGRNGAGKTSLLSVLLGRATPHLRHRGEVVSTGSFTYLPQVPVEHGLGVEPIGLSHVLSARGLDRLDADVHAARALMAKEPTEVNITRFSDLESTFTERGGYVAEGEVARLADGLGLREDLLLEDLSSLSGGQRRRVDLMRVLYEQAGTMVLDEPTNHLDRTAKRWLFSELANLPSALVLISHDIALLDHAIDKVLHLQGGTINEYKGNYTAFLRQSAEAPGTHRARSHRARTPRSSGSRSSPTCAATRPRSRPARRRSRTASSSAWRRAAPRWPPRSA